MRVESITKNCKEFDKGYGRRVLSHITDRIMLNIEETNETASNYEQRVKRKLFYIIQI